MKPFGQDSQGNWIVFREIAPEHSQVKSVVISKLHQSSLTPIWTSSAMLNINSKPLFMSMIVDAQDNVHFMQQPSTSTSYFLETLDGRTGSKIGKFVDINLEVKTWQMLSYNSSHLLIAGNSSINGRFCLVLISSNYYLDIKHKRYQRCFFGTRSVVSVSQLSSDSLGFVYLLGSFSSNSILVDEKYSIRKPSSFDGNCGFVLKLDSNLNPVLHTVTNSPIIETNFLVATSNRGVFAIFTSKDWFHISNLKLADGGIRNVFVYLDSVTMAARMGFICDASLNAKGISIDMKDDFPTVYLLSRSTHISDTNQSIVLAKVDTKHNSISLYSKTITSAVEYIFMDRKNSFKYSVLQTHKNRIDFLIHEYAINDKLAETSLGLRMINLIKVENDRDQLKGLEMLQSSTTIDTQAIFYAVLGIGLAILGVVSLSVVSLTPAGILVLIAGFIVLVRRIQRNKVAQAEEKKDQSFAIILPSDSATIEIVPIPVLNDDTLETKEVTEVEPAKQEEAETKVEIATSSIKDSDLLPISQIVSPVIIPKLSLSSPKHSDIKSNMSYSSDYLRSSIQARSPSRSLQRRRSIAPSPLLTNSPEKALEEDTPKPSVSRKSSISMSSPRLQQNRPSSPKAPISAASPTASKKATPQKIPRTPSRISSPGTTSRPTTSITSARPSTPKTNSISSNSRSTTPSKQSVSKLTASNLKALDQATSSPQRKNSIITSRRNSLALSLISDSHSTIPSVIEHTSTVGSIDGFVKVPPSMLTNVHASAKKPLNSNVTSPSKSLHRKNSTASEISTASTSSRKRQKISKNENAKLSSNTKQESSATQSVKGYATPNVEKDLSASISSASSRRGSISNTDNNSAVQSSLNSPTKKHLRLNSLDPLDIQQFIADLNLRRERKMSQIENTEASTQALNSSTTPTRKPSVVSISKELAAMSPKSTEKHKLEPVSMKELPPLEQNNIAINLKSSESTKLENLNEGTPQETEKSAHSIKSNSSSNTSLVNSSKPILNSYKNSTKSAGQTQKLSPRTSSPIKSPTSKSQSRSKLLVSNFFQAHSSDVSTSRNLSQSSTQTSVSTDFGKALKEDSTVNTSNISEPGTSRKSFWEVVTEISKEVDADATIHVEPISDKRFSTPRTPIIREGTPSNAEVMLPGVPALSANSISGLRNYERKSKIPQPPLKSQPSQHTPSVQKQFHQKIEQRRGSFWDVVSSKSMEFWKQLESNGAVVGKEEV